MMIYTAMLFIIYAGCMKTTVLSSSLVYNYEEKGPDSWPIEIPECGGKKQSPIDIQDWNAAFDPKLIPFNFINYNSNSIFNVSNSGYTIYFKPIDNSLGFNGSNFTEPYTLLQLHFHWGQNIHQGSEHYLDGKKFPLEMHLVHKTSSSIAVLGFFFSISNINNFALNGMIDAMKSNLSTVSINLTTILPSNDNLKSYYRYTGSLTTPPCTEGVIWTVFETPIPISESQLQMFSASTNTDKNFRDPQKLYCRNVASSKIDRRVDPALCSKGPTIQYNFQNTVIITQLILVTSKLLYF